MLAWLAAALELNAERGKMQMRIEKASSHGFAVNLSGVLMRLCDPFVDPLQGKAWGKLDAG